MNDYLTKYLEILGKKINGQYENLFKKINSEKVELEVKKGMIKYEKNYWIFYNNMFLFCRMY